MEKYYKTRTSVLEVSMGSTVLSNNSSLNKVYDNTMMMMKPLVCNKPLPFLKIVTQTHL